MVTRASAKARLIALFEEMADEAEHQDGDEYWALFASDDEAVQDYALYYAPDSIAWSSGSMHETSNFAFRDSDAKP